MFEYFKGNYAWNLTAITLIEEIGTISQPAQAFEVVAGLSDGAGEDANAAWFDAMSELGERVEGYAEEDLAAGNALSASRKFHRAAMYFIRAERISHGNPRRLEIYKRAMTNYRKAADYGQWGVEFVDIPFEDGFMPALFVPANSDGTPAPLLIHIQGFDSIKETQFPIYKEAKRRGLSVLIVDQPGAGGALRLHGLHARYDSEVYVSAIIDWVMSRDDMATERLGLCGISLGGYYAPRAAAFEPRVKACAAWGAIYDATGLAAPLLEGKKIDAPAVPDMMKHAMWSYGSKKPEDFIAVAQKLTLEGVVDKIKCPLLVMHGENDRQAPLEDHAVKTIENATMSDKTLKVFTIKEGGAEHCQIDDRGLAVDYITDWFASRL